MNLENKNQPTAPELGQWFDLGPTEEIYCLRGPGHVEFLNSYNSQDVKSLATPGVALGTFLTQKGKLVAPSFLVKIPDQFLILMPRGCGIRVTEHLKIYLDFSEVEFTDQSNEFFHLLFLGPQWPQGPLSELKAPELTESIQKITWEGHSLWALTSDRWGLPAYEILGPMGQKTAFLEALKLDSNSMAKEDLLEQIRIEAGLPKWGVDMNENNLVAEVGLDKRATSFNKGCYLGQETTARVQSQGKVNRQLTQWLLSEAPQSPSPVPLVLEDKEVGALTSWVNSPKHGGVVGLGIIQRKALDQPEQINLGKESSSMVLQPLAKEDGPKR